MKLILRINVTNLGEPGDVVDVAKGYGRNYLLPKGFAVEASAASLLSIEHEIAKLRAESNEMRQAAEAVAAQLASVTLMMSRKVADSETEILYGSVSVADIADGLAEQGIDVEKGNVHLEHPLKQLGEYEVPIALAHGVMGTVKVVACAEDSEEETIDNFPE